MVFVALSHQDIPIEISPIAHEPCYFRPLYAASKLGREEEIALKVARLVAPLLLTGQNFSQGEIYRRLLAEEDGDHHLDKYPAKSVLRITKNTLAFLTKHWFLVQNVARELMRIHSLVKATFAVRPDMLHFSYWTAASSSA